MSDSIHLISLFSIFISLQTVLHLRHNWSKFWDAKVTLEDRDLAMRVAIFILVPLGVLLHEIGHSLATWQVGGTVETFRWFFFSGYIIPNGDFSWIEYWWISLAGNLVSILLALLPIPFLFGIRKRIVAEVLYWFVCIQSIYALVYYPLYSASTKSGDWATIYNFRFFPLALFILVMHLGLLWGLWQLYHSNKILEWRLGRNPHTLENWKKLQQEQFKRPKDLQPKLNLAYFLLQHNETRQAKKIAKQIAKSYPNNNSVKVLQTLINCNDRAYERALKSGRELLNSELIQCDRAIVYRLLCWASYRKGKLDQALEYADRGLAIAPDDYMLLYHRAIIYQLLNKYEQAIANFDLALANNPDEDLRESIYKLKQRLL